MQLEVEEIHQQEHQYQLEQHKENEGDIFNDVSGLLGDGQNNEDNDRTFSDEFMNN